MVGFCSCPRVSRVVGSLVLGLLLALPGAAWADEAQLFVRVMSQTGEVVTDVTADEFVVEEDGVPCRIVSAQLGLPMKIALLVDNSEPAQESFTQLREGLAAFLDTLPPQHEIAFFTIARQILRVVDFTNDRETLKEATGRIFADRSSGAVVLDGLVETWRRRFEDDDFWPVFVLVGYDGPETSANIQQQDYDRFVAELMARSVTVNAVMVSLRGGNIQTTIAQNLTTNTGGRYVSLVTGSGLPDVLRQLATEMGEHYDSVADRYRVVYERASDSEAPSINAGVNRPALTVSVYPDRRMSP